MRRITPRPQPTEGLLDSIPIVGPLLSGIFGGGGGGGGQQQQQQGGAQQNPLGGLGPLLQMVAPIAGMALGGPLGGLAGQFAGQLLGGGGAAQQGLGGLLGGQGGVGNPLGMAATLGGQVVPFAQQMMGLQGQQMAQGLTQAVSGAINPQLAQIQQSLANSEAQTQATAEHRTIQAIDNRHREVMTGLRAIEQRVGAGGPPRRF